ncbi:MAG TPA: MarR family transcriptional regulator [Gemmatimonadaceae bacterium]|jgi:DNA-binding MarR family transcriptional regulator
MNNAPNAPTMELAKPGQAISSILHAAHALEAKVESTLGAVGLSMPKFSVLSELVATGQALSLSELANRLSCVRSNMTQLVDRLEADGLVRRVNCPEDRRSVKAEITDLGREKQAAGQAAYARLDAEFGSAVGPTERNALEKMLSALK